MRFALLPYYRRNLEILDETLHDSLAVYGDSFLTDVFSISNANNNSGCIVFLFSYAVAMFKHGEIRFSILMKLESLFQIERYNEEAYQISGIECTHHTS